MRSDKKMEFFIFIIVCKGFWPLTFLGDFWYLFNGFELGIKFCISLYWYKIFEEKNCLLKLSLFANFKAKIRQNYKKMKKVFYK